MSQSQKTRLPLNVSVPWWARNPHIQTILPTLLPSPKSSLRRERLELDDSDFIDLDWLDQKCSTERVIVILHGLEGSSNSPYVRRLLDRCKQSQIPAVVHHHRSCSGENNRLPRSYHSGETSDMASTFRHVKSLYPQAKIQAVGYSLGGNALAKYLGEQGQNSLVDRAVIVSAPLHLAACAKRLEGGFSTIYQRHLIQQLKRKTAEKIANPVLQEHMPLSIEQLNKISTFYQFDDLVTSPLHGFADVHDYYAKSSGLPFLRHITTPTLIIHAADDPFMTDAVIPTSDQLSEHVSYELDVMGGHVGFITGGYPWRLRYGLEDRIKNFFNF